MGKPHVHAEVIKAWADGKQIQYRGSEEREWKDCIHNICLWLPSTQYRVKPGTIRYRVALMNNGRNFTISTMSAEGEANVQDQCSFVRWLTNWIEVEV